MNDLNIAGYGDCGATNLGLSFPAAFIPLKLPKLWHGALSFRIAFLLYLDFLRWRLVFFFPCLNWMRFNFSAFLCCLRILE